MVYQQHLEDAQASIEQYTNDLKRLNATASRIIEIAEQIPDSALIQSYAASFFLYGQSDACQIQGETYLRRAQRLSHQLDPLQMAFLNANVLLFNKQYSAAANQLESLCEAAPDDMMALKLLEFIYYCLGQHFCGERYLQMTEKLFPILKNDVDFLACHGFALNLAGQYTKAERLLKDCLNQEPRLPWAHHGLAHALINQSKIDEGIALFEQYTPNQPQYAPFIQAHNSWHLALFYLENLDYESTLSVFNAHIWEQDTSMIPVQIDAISLLWRIEMSGTEIDPNLWAKVAQACIDNAASAYFPFMNAHFLYAASKALHPVEPLFERCERAYLDSKAQAPLWQRLGKDLCRASIAFANQDALLSAQLLLPLERRMVEAGGSDAQIDLFRQTLLISLIRSGQTSAAKAYYERLFKDKAQTPLLKKWQSLMRDNLPS